MKFWGRKSGGASGASARGKEKDVAGERVYLDWAAATPLLPAAKAAMLPFLENDFGNASAIHQEGQVARPPGASRIRHLHLWRHRSE